MIWRWLHRHPWLVDLSIVGLLLAVGVGAAVENRHSEATAVALSAAVFPLSVSRFSRFKSAHISDACW